MNLTKFQYDANYTFNKIFPIEKISSTISICHINNDPIEISDIITQFTNFGEIQDINSIED